VTPEIGELLDKARDCLARARIILAAGVGEDAGRDAYLAGFHVAGGSGLNFRIHPKRLLQLVYFGPCEGAEFSEKITHFIRYLIDPHCVYDPGWRYGNPKFRLQILIEHA
jgi:hypothetical protein